MGLYFACLFNKHNFSPSVRILMIGLDDGGKTTILYKLKLGEVVNTIPTIGFNVEIIKKGKLEFVVWDVGGQEKIRTLWRHYYGDTFAIIWVVSSFDRSRIEESRKELDIVLSDRDLQDVPLLVFANKQDLLNTLNLTEITEKLNLNSLTGIRKWKIQGCSATSGDGLYEGLDWLRTVRDLK